ncbi:MAG: hypothetical protein JWP91_3624 [Fibrobacteres bacterium]|nr:hypothetical protein [Fibrobacterota bacterium]
MRLPAKRVSNGLPFLLAAMAVLAAGPRADIVSVINGFSVTYPGNKFGEAVVQGVPQDYVKLPPANEYYLDYQVWFESDWQWVKGGKLPGLVGGSHTSGCKDIVADGWSARFMWHDGGGGHFYYYHQNRVNDCGDVRNFANGLAFKKSAWNRITEHVVVNAPGQANGSAQAWLNGAKVTDMTGIKWRGSVAATVAMVDQVSLQTFYGGSTSDWSPTSTTHSRFSAFVVRTDLPDFSKPFEAPAVLNGGTLENGRDPSALRPGQRLAVTFLGNGLVPVLPNGAMGSRMTLSDVQGRLAGGLAWDGSRWQWSGGAEGGGLRGSLRPGILVARYEARTLP